MLGCLKEKADKGEIDAMLKYGLRLLKGDGVPINTKEAKKYIKMAASNGDPVAKTEYHKIINEKPSKQDAFDIIKPIADSGNTKAMLTCGIILSTDDGEPYNLKEATKYFKLSADNGNINGMYQYALALDCGNGIPVDKIAASHYYKMAADNGHVSAMLNISKDQLL